MKVMLKAGCVGVIALGGLFAILGSDAIPMLDAGRESVRSQFLNMVDSHDLKLAQVKQQLSQCKKAFSEQAESRYRLQALHDRLSGQIHDAEMLADAERDKLESLQTRLVSVGTVYDTSGQAMSNAQVARQVKLCQQRLRAAQARQQSLSVVLSPCKKRLERLDQACEEAPHRMKLLSQLCDDLKDKIAMAKEMHRWTKELTDSAPDTTMTPESIELALKEIDEDIGAEMAGCMAVLSLEEPSADQATPMPTGSLIHQIELALAN